MDSSRCCDVIIVSGRRLDMMNVCRRAHTKSIAMLSGSDGAFAGAEEQNYVILSAEGRSLCIYASQPSKKPPTVLKRIDLPLGGATSLFSGPAWGSLPRCAASSSCISPYDPARTEHLATLVPASQMAAWSLCRLRTHCTCTCSHAGQISRSRKTGQATGL